MRIVGRNKVEGFCKGRADAEKRLRAWHSEGKHANWKTPQEVKKVYRTARILGTGRVVFNICGNKYRIVVKINYGVQVVEIRFIGTHKEYDRINAEEI